MLVVPVIHGTNILPDVALHRWHDELRLPWLVQTNRTRWHPQLQAYAVGLDGNRRPGM